jgi:hypothetical protein
MNKITVIAWGGEGSFARNVQHDPTIAIHLKQALEAMFKEFGDQGGRAVTHADSVLQEAERWMKPGFLKAER